MAPESERAKECKCERPYEGTRAVGTPNRCERCRGLIVPTEPTLTCSEVVERLEREAVKQVKIADDYYEAQLDHELATAILHAWLDRHLMQVRHDYRTELKKATHSWRERRVQELEEALLKYGRHLVTCPHLSENMRSNSDCNCGWEKLLANSEWREQIRKGAKHE